MTVALVQSNQRALPMPSQVYILARDHVGLDGSCGTPRTDAINAVAVAAMECDGFRYEALTDERNPKPVISMGFCDRSSMEAFAERLARSVTNWNMRILTVHTTTAGT